MKSNNIQQSVKDNKDNNLSNVSSSSNVNLNTMSSLTKIIKNDEDLLFPSERKVTNEQDIYDIENKLSESNREENSNYFRQNYISNREVQIQTKIIPDTHDSIQEDFKKFEQEKQKIEEEKKIKKIKSQKQSDINKEENNNKNKKLIGPFEILSIGILLILILLLLGLLLYFVFQ